MANLQKCSKCKSDQELKYFSINKKGQPYKTCDNCRNKREPASDNQSVLDAIKLMTDATHKLEETIKDTPSSSSDIEDKSTTLDLR